MTKQGIDHAQIATLIPHSGTMCLLDRVESWNEIAITCLAGSHRDQANPLRGEGMLPGLAGVEYAAQAMAVHGALTAATNSRPRAGYLASLRELTCRADRLDDLAGELTIFAEQLMASGAQVIYRFTVTANEREVLAGRAAVVLEAMA